MKLKKPNTLTRMELKPFPFEHEIDGSLLKLEYTDARGARKGVTLALKQDADLREVVQAFDNLVSHLRVASTLGGKYSPERPAL